MYKVYPEINCGKSNKWKFAYRIYANMEKQSSYSFRNRITENLKNIDLFNKLINLNNYFVFSSSNKN